MEKFNSLNLFKILYLFLTSDLMKAVRGQKHPSGAKKGMKEFSYSKKCVIKVAQQPQKPLQGPIKFELQPQQKVLKHLEF